MNLSNLIIVFSILFLSSCSKNDDETTPDAAGTYFGKITTAMVLVNPVINKGSVTTIPSGTIRSGVNISSGSINATTDANGISLLKNLPTGANVPLSFSSGGININIVQPKEFYDVVVSYSEKGVQEIIQEIRYPLGGDMIRVNANMSNKEINAALAGQGKIVYFEPGTYTGNIEITDSDVLMFGSYNEVSKQYTSVIAGNIAVKSKFVRMRGLVINGDLNLTGSDFSASYCKMINASMPGNNITLIHNTFSGTANVTGNNVVLLDNAGL